MASSKDILAKIRALGPVVHGSLVESTRTCGNKACKCARGQRHHAFYLSRRIEGKTRLEYVSKADVHTVRMWRKNHQRLMALVEELTTALLRELRESRK
jgi:hypothetical protein